MTRFRFDTRTAIAHAWAFLWADNLRQRKEMSKPGAFNYGLPTTFYLTASDVESQVRRFARETAEGKPWGSTGRAMGREGAWTAHGKLRMPGGLNGDVRDWLLHNRDIESHNFGKGHISGMRFRPRGEPLGEAEVKTMERKTKQKADRAAGKLPPRHYSADRYGSTILCVKRRALWSRRRRQPWSTNVADEVTCPRCRNKLKAQEERDGKTSSHQTQEASN